MGVWGDNGRRWSVYASGEPRLSRGGAADSQGGHRRLLSTPTSDWFLTTSDTALTVVWPSGTGRQVVATRCACWAPVTAWHRHAGTLARWHAGTLARAAVTLPHATGLVCDLDVMWPPDAVTEL
jgi:hypothetical protein